jgi:SpoVK/Ycf46/Vps4 family AAA+-type ATPase
MFERHKETKGQAGVKPLTDAQITQVTHALCGMTAQDAEEAVALALVEHQGISNLEDFIDTLEREKSKVIAAIPGLTYIPKDQIVGDIPPGYEELVERLNDYVTEDGECHVRGISLGGIAGTAKTVTAKFIARYLKRIALLVDMGGLKGSLVGESEKNMRRAFQIGNALHAVMIFDDVDKGGLNKGRDYGGDGGTTGNMIQSMLTMMSDPACHIVFVFTFNRVPNMPELLRLGRVDLRLYVEEPKNIATRLGIFKFGLKQFGVTVDDEERLLELSGKPTEGMTGAEIIHGIIKPAGLRAKKSKSTVLSTEYMLKLTDGFTPMLKQKRYAEDIAQLREDCSQFLKIGNLPDTSSSPAATMVRSRRGVTTN